MEFPSWREFIEKKRIFDQEVDNQRSKRVKGLSDKRQIAIAFKTSLHVLPPPFDAMAESIYESVEGYDKEKLSEVKKFLHAIKTRGEDHYNELAPKLGKITHDIIDLKNDTARQSTLLYVRDIIISSSDTIDQKLHKIARAQEELSELKTSQWLADEYKTSKESDFNQ
ncbi:MAG: hypothetical protein WAM14_14395 [Candidatus Nitrosopolaris sp.]